MRSVTGPTNGVSKSKASRNSPTFGSKRVITLHPDWDCYSRAALLLAMTTTLLGRRAFQMLGRKPGFPAPSAGYPWVWILSSLRKKHARELRWRVAMAFRRAIDGIQGHWHGCPASSVARAFS